MLQSKSRRSACRERSTQNANIVIPANCKTKTIIDAQAEAEKQENLQREKQMLSLQMEAKQRFI
jgi:hypothetical protein